MDIIDKKNIKNYNSHINRFICRKCKRYVTLDNSYSNKGKNLMCMDCVDGIREKEGLTFNSEVCEKYIWID